MFEPRPFGPHTLQRLHSICNGSYISRVYDSSSDGLWPAGLTEIVGQDVPEFTAVKAYPALSQSQTSPQRCLTSSGPHPRRQRQDFRRGERQR